MQNLPYLFVTYGIVFVALFAYLVVIAAQVRGVQRDLDAIKVRVDRSPREPRGHAG
ncbi:MAG TPA: hypothetical protein VKZ60_17250 [Chloroflexota bacterium]|jgi:hypothetical protein|nr:hypothetical protein [Chloroflexota bacterium]